MLFLYAQTLFLVHVTSKDLVWVQVPNTTQGIWVHVHRTSKQLESWWGSSRTLPTEFVLVVYILPFCASITFRSPVTAAWRNLASPSGQPNPMTTDLPTGYWNCFCVNQQLKHIHTNEATYYVLDRSKLGKGPQIREKDAPGIVWAYLLLVKLETCLLGRLF